MQFTVNTEIIYTTTNETGLDQLLLLAVFFAPVLPFQQNPVETPKINFIGGISFVRAEKLPD